MAEWLLAVDPGTRESGVLWYSSEGKILEPAVVPNEVVLDIMETPPAEAALNPCYTIAVEAIACYGEAIGVETLETELLVGRLVQHWIGKTRVQVLRHRELATKRIKTLVGDNGRNAILVYRKEVCKHLCNTSNAKDSNVHQSIVDRYGPSMSKAKGNKRNPGPLYGIATHMWSALGVAITATEKSAYYLSDVSERI